MIYYSCDISSLNETDIWLTLKQNDRLFRQRNMDSRCYDGYCFITVNLIVRPHYILIFMSRNTAALCMLQTQTIQMGKHHFW